MTTKHPFSKILIAIANGESIEFSRNAKAWGSITPYHALSAIVEGEADRLRIKPRTVTINGHTIAAPECKPLNDGQCYWIVELVESDHGYQWDGDEFDFEWLRAGVIHLNRCDAHAHRDALLSFTRAKNTL